MVGGSRGGKEIEQCQKGHSFYEWPLLYLLQAAAQGTQEHNPDRLKSHNTNCCAYSDNEPGFEDFKFYLKKTNTTSPGVTNPVGQVRSADEESELIFQSPRGSFFGGEQIEKSL